MGFFACPRVNDHSQNVEMSSSTRNAVGRPCIPHAVSAYAHECRTQMTECERPYEYMVGTQDTDTFENGFQMGYTEHKVS